MKWEEKPEREERDWLQLGGQMKWKVGSEWCMLVRSSGGKRRGESESDKERWPVRCRGEF